MTNKTDKFIFEFQEKLLLKIKEKFDNPNNFSKKTSISQSTISRYLKGEGLSSIMTLKNIAKSLNISLDWLLLDEYSQEEKIDSIDYDLLDEVILLVNEYASSSNIKVGSKHYITIYNAISKFKTTNPNTSTKDIFKLLKPTLETFSL